MSFNSGLSGSGFSDFATGLDTLFGSSATGSTKGSGTSTTEGTTSTTETFSTEAFAEAIERLIAFSEEATTQQQETAQAGTTREDQQVSALDEETLGQIQQFVTGLTQSFQELESTGAVNLDFDALRNNAISEVIDAGIIDVIAQNLTAGTFENTATAQAAERLGVRAVEAGVDTEATARLQQAQVNQQQGTDLLAAISNLFGVQKGAVTQSTSTGATTDTGTAVSAGTTTSKQEQTGTQEQTQVSTGDKATDTAVDSTTTTETKTSQKSRDKGVLGGLF